MLKMLQLATINKEAEDDLVYSLMVEGEVSDRAYIGLENIAKASGQYCSLAGRGAAV